MLHIGFKLTTPENTSSDMASFNPWKHQLLMMASVAALAKLKIIVCPSLLNTFIKIQRSHARQIP